MIRKLIVAMVAAAMLVAMAVPAFAQSPFDLALQLQNCEQVNANVAAIDQDQTNTNNQSGDIQRDASGFIVLNTGSVVNANSTDQNNEARVDQENERNVQVCAALQWANDGFGDPKKDGGPTSAPAAVPGL